MYSVSNQGVSDRGVGGHPTILTTVLWVQNIPNKKRLKNRPALCLPHDRHVDRESDASGCERVSLSC